MHAFKVGEHYVPYSRCAELGIYTHKACGVMLILEERSHTSAEYCEGLYTETLVFSDTRYRTFFTVI